MRRCTLCTLPETHETITFDDEGVCSVCKNARVKDEIDWESRLKDLMLIADGYRGKKDYDCIIPFSGGKDSTWTLFYVVKVLKLKPLVVTFDHGFYRPKLLKNREKTFQKLGVDSLVFTPNWKLVRKVMLQSFIDKGDFCWHCHTGIFSYPMQIAIEKGIELVIWGEPSSEYTSYYDYSNIEEVDEERFNRIINLGISAEDMFIRLDGEFDERDFKPFSYPSLSELSKNNTKSIPLGSYIPWDVKKQVEVISTELDWEGDEVEGVPPGFEYEKIECYMQGVRDYIKFIKRGYARTTHLTSIDIRNGRTQRPEAIKLIENFEGTKPFALDLFLEITGLNLEEFMTIALRHKIDETPTSNLLKIGKKPKDFDLWSRKEGIPPEEKSVIMHRTNM